MNLTFKAVHSVLGVGTGEAGLVLELVQCPDPQQPPAALRPGHGDGVAHAAVRQPAVVAAVEARPPGGVQLARGRQHRVPGQTLLTGLLQGQLGGDGRVEDLPCMGQRAGEYSSKEAGRFRVRSPDVLCLPLGLFERDALTPT